MTLPVPTEDIEQERVVRYCDIKRLPRFRVPNETYTKSWAQKRKNKVLGVSPGVPDLFVVANGRLIAIEMKRQKGGRLTAPQADWLMELNGAGVEARMCKGADEAIEFIEGVLDGQEKKT